MGVEKQDILVLKNDTSVQNVTLVRGANLLVHRVLNQGGVVISLAESSDDKFTVTKDFLSRNTKVFNLNFNNITLVF